jgi:hypothetical protein
MIFLADTEIWTIGNTASQPIFGVLEGIMKVIMEVNERVTYLWQQKCSQLLEYASQNTNIGIPY